MRGLMLALALALAAAPVAAQPLAVDRPFHPLPTTATRQAADVASWATVAAAVALDTVQTFDGHCSSVAGGNNNDQVLRCVELQAGRIGATYGVVYAAKLLVHRLRPCAPDCGIDAADQSFFSGHTALAFSTLGGPRLAFALPLAIGTGGLRVAAGKHYVSDVVTGAIVGALTSRIR